MRATAAEAGGFTLIELAVVVMVIGILMAVSIPTFLGAKTSSEDGQAQEALIQAVTVATQIYAASESFQSLPLQDFTTNNQAPFFAGNPKLNWFMCASIPTTCDENGVGTATVGQIAVLSWTGSSGVDTAMTLAVTSASGNCWYVILHSSEPKDYGVVPGKTCSVIQTNWFEPGFAATSGTGTPPNSLPVGTIVPTSGTPISQLNQFPPP